MQTLKSGLRLALASAAFLALGITAALAPGSIPLDEVMEQLKDNGKLIDEISGELKKQNINAEKVVCIARRFGNQWVNLGGARAIPYNCTVGSRTLDIDGELHLYDAAGKELDMEAPDAPAQATEYKRLNLMWKWS